MAIDYDPSTINMLEFKTGIDLPVILHINEGLMSSDYFTGKRANGLAASFTLLKNKKDIKVTIEKGHTFHTGDPVTAHDVKWTYEQVADPINANILGSTVSEIESVEVLNDHTFIFHFYEPYGPWDDIMWIGICSKNYFDKVGRDEFRSKPVGSGPFRFVEQKRGSSITLEAVENYLYKDFIHNKKTGKIIKTVRKKVDYKTLKFLIVSDQVTQVAMLETGELDLITSVMPHFVDRLKRNKNIKVKRESEIPSLTGLSIKPDNFPVWKDRNLRLALRHAIDKQAIVDRVFQGEGYPLYQYCSKGELGYDPNLKFAYDPEKCRALVKKSSYVPGTPMILTYTSAVRSAPLVATIIQKYLQDIGLTVKLQQLEPGVQATYTRTRDKREGHMTLYTWDGGRDPNLRLLLYTWDGGRDPNLRLLMSVISDSDYSSWTTRPDKEILDKLILQQKSEPDRAKRLALIKKTYAQMRTEPGGNILFGLNMIYAMRDRIDYVYPKSNQQGIFCWFEESL
ncbi:MAG: ABC transporter substrate-binding protein [Deltaproteobacteria bacterium]|nr:ABC transporter substrate-binding protein [Deltaproteobacteria bacterium]